MIYPNARNPISELAYYIRENEEHDFLNEPSLRHIFIDSLNAELLVAEEDKIVIEQYVAYSLLLLAANDPNSLGFVVMANDTILSEEVLVSLNIINHSLYKDPMNWFELYDIVEQAYGLVQDSIVYYIHKPIISNAEVRFKVTEIIDSRKEGSTIELDKIYTGQRDGNSNRIYFDDVNGQQWTFWIGTSCELI